MTDKIKDRDIYFKPMKEYKSKKEKEPIKTKDAKWEGIPNPENIGLILIKQ